MYDFERLFSADDAAELKFTKKLMKALEGQAYDIHIECGSPCGARSSFGVTEINFVVGPQFEPSKGVYVEYHFYNYHCIVNGVDMVTGNPNKVLAAIHAQMKGKVA